MPYKATLAFQVGQKIGRLTLLKVCRVGEGRARKIVWMYQCDCGKCGRATNSNLTSGHTLSCGCLRRELLQEKQTYRPGQKVGRLILLRRSTVKRNGCWISLWDVQCDCGTQRRVHQTDLTTGGTRSCGCLQREVVARMKTTHGESDKTTEWSIWQGMIQRCENKNLPAYKNYGGRGIQICKKWRESYSAFLNDVGRRPSMAHTLNRKDNEKGYSPENIEWATYSQQSRNRRSNRFIVIDGVKRMICDWADIYGIKYSLAYYRLKRGWDPKAAFTAPVNSRISKLSKT